MSQRLQQNAVVNLFAIFFLYTLVAVALTMCLSTYAIDSESVSELLTFIATPVTKIIQSSPLPERFEFSQITLGLFIVTYFSCLVMHFALMSWVHRARPDYQYSSGIKLLKSNRVKKHASSALKKSRQKVEVAATSGCTLK